MIVLKRLSDKLLLPASDQRGLNNITAVAALAGIGIVFILIFLFAGAPGTPNAVTKDTKDTTETPTETASNQPSVIRIPDNYKTYVNQDYKFSFAYPSAWGDLNVIGQASAGTATFAVQSGPFAQYALGNSQLNGQVSAYVYPKDNFKLSLGGGGALVSPVKLGDTYSWKVVETGVANPTLKVGDSYNVKANKYQAGVPIYDFTIAQGTSVQGRWSFQAGDTFVVVVLPAMTRADGTPPAGSDLTTYNAIGNNMSKTMRPTL